jgi:hypothetical protein
MTVPLPANELSPAKSPETKRELTLGPLCEIIPPCTDTEFTELKEDMKQNGLRVPIKLFQTRILDGRSRYKAYSELWDEGRRIELRTETFTGSHDEAIAYVISMNVKRRHLKPSQRAVIAARLVTTRLGGDRSVKLPTEITQEDVARLAGVATKTVTDAKKVLEDTELTNKVLSGEMAVGKAAKQIRQRETQGQSEDQGEDNNSNEQRVAGLVTTCTKRLELLVDALDELRLASSFLVAKQNAEQAKARIDVAISQMRNADKEADAA